MSEQHELQPIDPDIIAAEYLLGSKVVRSLIVVPEPESTEIRASDIEEQVRVIQGENQKIDNLIGCKSYWAEYLTKSEIEELDKSLLLKAEAERRREVKKI